VTVRVVFPTGIVVSRSVAVETAEELRELKRFFDSCEIISIVDRTTLKHPEKILRSALGTDDDYQTIVRS
jgi:hypothetical protein